MKFEQRYKLSIDSTDGVSVKLTNDLPYLMNRAKEEIEWESTDYVYIIDLDTNEILFESAGSFRDVPPSNPDSDDYNDHTFNEAIYMFRLSTILENKGGNFNVSGAPIEFIEGYSVSLAGYEFRMPLANITQELVTAHGDAVADILLAGNLDNCYVGCWVTDTELVMDISTNIKKYEDALLFAKAGKQEAIWDFANQLEIEIVYP